MSLINTKIKNFSNIAFKNGKFVKITEKDIQGKWNIFFFYPADFTFICPTELNDLANHYENFQKLGAEIFSISTDTHFSHKAWFDYSKSISKIKFHMIGDPSWELTRNFEIMKMKHTENQELKESGLADRGTFIIDPNGIIQSIEISSEGVGRNAQELLNKLKALQYIEKNPNEVCPAKWIENKKTLKPSIDLVGKI